MPPSTTSGHRCSVPPAPRRLVVLLTALLAAITAVTLAAAAVVLPAPLGTPEQSAATEALIYRFYAAANTALTTGDATQLTALLASDDAPPLAPTARDSQSGSLAQRLAAIHAIQPSLSIVVEAVVADDDEAVAWVTLAGQTTTAPIVVPNPVGDGRLLDGFRVRDGRIVVLWGATARLAAPTVVVAATVEAPGTATTLVSTSRLTLAPGSAIRTLVAAGPLAVVVETGTLQARFDTRGQLIGAMPGGVHEIRPIAPSTLHTLAPSDHIIIGAGSPVGLQNQGAEPAVALIVAVLPPPVVEPTMAGTRDDMVHGHASAQVVVLDDGNWENAWTNGITGRRIGSDEIPVPDGERLQITVSRTLLQPDSMLRGSTERPQLLVAENGPIVAIHTWDGIDRAVVIAPGETLVVPGGHTVRLRGASDEPVSTLLLSLEPVTRGIASDSMVEHRRMLGP